MSDRIEMKVTMQVTPAQALALKAMFEHWNKMASWGASRIVAFYVDGDGNFKPKVEVSMPDSVPQLTDEMRENAMNEISEVSTIGEGDVLFDFDSIAWILHN